MASCRRSSSALDCVLGFAVAERPVLFLDLDKTDKDVLPPEPDSRVKAVGDGFVERLFLLRAPSLVPGDLYNDEVIAAVDANIIGIEQEVVVLVFTNNLESVVLGYTNIDECFIDNAADLLPVGRILAFTNIDTNKWHKLYLVSAEMVAA